MKKILSILFVCVAIGIAGQAWAAPEPIPAIENVAPDVPSAKGGFGRIYFVAGGEDALFSIYSITGQLLKNVKVPAENHFTMDMPKGFYVVRCNGLWSRKVVVR